MAALVVDALAPGYAITEQDLRDCIAAQGETMTFKIQAKAGLKNGEFTADELRELHVFIAQYCGYPRAASMIGPMEEAIAEATKELEESE